MTMMAATINNKKRVQQKQSLLNSTATSANTRISASCKTSIDAVTGYSSSIHIVQHVNETKYYKKPEIITPRSKDKTLVNCNIVNQSCITLNFICNIVNQSCVIIIIISNFKKIKGRMKCKDRFSEEKKELLSVNKKDWDFDLTQIPFWQLLLISDYYYGF